MGRPILVLDHQSLVKRLMTNARQWIPGVSLVLCTIAALVGGRFLALQGNNWLWSGFFIGAVLGFTIPALLLHGISEMLKGPPRMKLKRMAKVACFVVCALIVCAVLSNGTGNTEFVIAPKDWRLSVAKVDVEMIHETNGPATSFTNRVSQIGPVIFTEFNR